MVDATKDRLGRGVAWNLDALGILWGTDKARGHHGYTRHYARHLRAKRHAISCVLEIGIGGYRDPTGGGNSLRMWRNYFPGATIYGLDVYAKRFADGRRLIALQGDQSDPSTLRRVVHLCPPFDLVVDDGSHVRSHIVASFDALFPALKPGGLYAIEDLNPADVRGHETGDHGTPRPGAGAAGSLSDDLLLEQRSVAAVHTYPGLVLIQKGRIPTGVR